MNLKRLFRLFNRYTDIRDVPLNTTVSDHYGYYWRRVRDELSDNTTDFVCQFKQGLRDEWPPFGVRHIPTVNANSPFQRVRRLWE